MGNELTPWKEESRRGILQSAINRAAENPHTDAMELRELWDAVAEARLTKTEMHKFRLRLRAILSKAKTDPGEA